MITNNDTVHIDKCYTIQDNNNNEDSSAIMEKILVLVCSPHRWIRSRSKDIA